MIDPAAKPARIKLKDIPRQFIVDSRIDWKAVQGALGLTDQDKLKDALLFLYQSDWVVNYHLNEALLRVAVPALAGLYVLPPAPSTDEEAPWMSADVLCERCPGSEYIDYGGGFAAPRCGNINRVERYSECLKYRENLQAAVLTPDEVQQRYQQALTDLEEILNVNTPKPEGSAERPGHVDSYRSLDRNLATDVVVGLFGADPSGGPGPEAV